MESLNPKEENVIKDIRNLFRQQKKLNYTATKDIRNLFQQKKKSKQLKIEYLRTLIFFLSMKRKKIIINQ